MSDNGTPAEQAEALLATPDLAEVLDRQHFKEFLDKIPIAIAVSHLRPVERISYANPEFERLAGIPEEALKGQGGKVAAGSGVNAEAADAFAAAVESSDDHVGEFAIGNANGQTHVDVWSSVILDATGESIFRLVALTIAPSDELREAVELAVRDKDTLLRELQHRVSNNLQMITALIRMEARSTPSGQKDIRLDRLAGRVNALAMLYRTLSDSQSSGSVDLGSYLSEIAAAVMKAHSTEGIRLSLKVDSWIVSANVAMPTGLVVNEILTNSLKHAFAERDSGIISLECLVDGDFCKVIVSDDGVGLAKVHQWPKIGGLGALILRSLKENAKAKVEVASEPGKGMRVKISFVRETDA